MEVEVRLYFDDPDNQGLWEEVFNGLQDHQIGAKLQMRMKPFGNKVGKALEKMLNKWDVSYFYVEGYRCISGSFLVDFTIIHIDAEVFGAELASLLIMCGAKNVRVEYVYEE